MTNSCSKKCVSAYTDTELNTAELACIDRCASKYLQTQEKVGEVLQNYERQMMQQMGQMPK
jgi:import inner membrane translocase subunit TIM10